MHETYYERHVQPIKYGAHEDEIDYHKDALIKTFKEIREAITDLDERFKEIRQDITDLGDRVSDLEDDV